MADADLDKPPPEFMSALVTEHFVLQGTSSSTISESGSRVSIYLSALSSGLVAIGFASGSHRALEALALTVLPTVFILGCFTIVRLIDTSVANVVAQRRMARITAYYATLHSSGAPYFEADDRGMRYGRWSLFFTMASMVIVVNSVVGGATLALVFALAIHAAAPVPIVVGIATGVVVLVLSLRYEHRRVTHVVLSGPGGMEPG
jgi:hypothetical protein